MRHDLHDAALVQAAGSVTLRYATQIPTIG
jgi:hypothetical protein